MNGALDDLAHWVLDSLASTDAAPSASRKSSQQYRRNATAIRSVLAADERARLELHALRARREGVEVGRPRAISPVAPEPVRSDRVQGEDDDVGRRGRSPIAAGCEQHEGKAAPERAQRPSPPP